MGKTFVEVRCSLLPAAGSRWVACVRWRGSGPGGLAPWVRLCSDKDDRVRGEREGKVFGEGDGESIGFLSALV